MINFSFPTEPKRYLHRIGRTARAGGSGVALTICNDEERHEIRRLARRLSHNVTAYHVSPGAVRTTHSFVQRILDPLLQDLKLEMMEDRELEKAYREAARAENLIKYKEEINSRPRASWGSTREEKLQLKRDSRKDLKNIKEKFDKGNGNAQPERLKSTKKR